MGKGGFGKGDDGKKGGKGGEKGKGKASANLTDTEWDGLGHQDFLRRIAKKPEVEFNFRRCADPKCTFVTSPNRHPPHRPKNVLRCMSRQPLEQDMRQVHPEECGADQRGG